MGAIKSNLHTKQISGKGSDIVHTTNTSMRPGGLSILLHRFPPPQLDVREESSLYSEI